MILKHVHHPNIIRMQEVLHSPNVIYIVMELGHKDLHTYASNVGITEDSTREIMAGILTPLKHLHSIGICHLDIKPENIMVMKDVPAHELSRDHIKLCDFGLCVISSCTQDPVVSEVTLKGTPGFFAPEMVEGAFDAKPADMWSVGCTLMELSEGFMEGWFESYSMYRKDTANFHLGIRNCLTMVQDRDYFADVHIFELVRDLLRMEPEHRLTASQVLEHDWFLNDGSQ
jgi:serine/threonine protein kinase